MAGKTRRKRKEAAPPPAEEQEEAAAQEEPGYCVGHYDKRDKSCGICEIQDECMRLTEELAAAGQEDEEDGNG